MTVRVVFMGTPEAAVQVLKGLLDAKHNVLAVYTQPDKPTGRGRQMEAPPVKIFAVERGLSVFQPTTLRRPESLQPLLDLKPDVLVVAAYGKILPRYALAAAAQGGLNIHPSLLPRHRGPTPIPTTILEGDTLTGVSIICMDEGMDSGPMLSQRREPVYPEDTTGSLTERLFGIGTAILLEAIEPWIAGDVRLQMQNHAEATFTKMLRHEDAELDFTNSAAQLDRQVRAYQPSPGAYTSWDRKNLKVIESSALGLQSGLQPGRVFALPPGAPSAVGVATGDGTLVLKRVQLEGKRPATIAEFTRGYQNFLNAMLTSKAAHKHMNTTPR